MSRLIFPAWVPDHATLEYVLPRLLNPTMTPPDFDPTAEGVYIDDRWRLGMYVEGQWIMNRDVRLSWIGLDGVIYPQLPKPYKQDEEGNDIKLGDTPIPGLHLDLHAIGKPLHNYLMHNPETGEPWPQQDEEGNPLPIYDSTCIRLLLGDLVDVPETEGVAAGIVGSSAMKMLNNLTINSKRLEHQ